MRRPLLLLLACAALAVAPSRGPTPVRAPVTATATAATAAPTAATRPSRSPCHRAKGPRRGRAQIPEDTLPPEHPELWPRSLAVEGAPIRIHYRGPDEEATARTVARLVVDAWRLNTVTLGFRAPPDDGGVIGPDGRFDIFLWRGLDECWVDVHAPVESTPWDDALCYMALDPWGSYGGEALACTVSHELNHACQAADDWYDAPALYEMTATWTEQQVIGMRLAEPLADFQAHPDWGFDHDDEYDSWFMYGSALFLDFLQEHRFGGDRRFASALWKGCRSPAGAEDDPSRNEPDALDSLELLLRGRGSSFDDAWLEFARWRARIGSPAPGGIVTRLAPVAPLVPMPSVETSRVATTRAPFRPGAQVRFGGPRTARVAGRVDGGPGPMRLGSRYVTFTRGPNDPAKVRISARLAAGARWVVQSVPGPAGEPAGARVSLRDGLAVLECPAGGEVLLILTAMPEGTYDTDDKDDRRFGATLTLGAAP